MQSSGLSIFFTGTFLTSTSVSLVDLGPYRLNHFLQFVFFKEFVYFIQAFQFLGINSLSLFSYLFNVCRICSGVSFILDIHSLYVLPFFPFIIQERVLFISLMVSQFLVSLISSIICLLSIPLTFTFIFISFSYLLWV